MAPGVWVETGDEDTAIGSNLCLPEHSSCHKYPQKAKVDLSGEVQSGDKGGIGIPDPGEIATDDQSPGRMETYGSDQGVRPGAGHERRVRGSIGAEKGDAATGGEVHPLKISDDGEPPVGQPEGVLDCAMDAHWLGRFRRARHW